MACTEEITHLLRAAGAGDESAVDQLFAHLYGELRDLAHRKLGHGRRARTLNTTALVNEAYLKLIEPDRLTLVDRNHFLSLSARIMRQILVDYARRHRTQKRGRGAVYEELDEAAVRIDARAEDLIALDHAVRRLESLDPRLARVVELRFFGGCSTEEIAEIVGISTPTVKRDWRKARAFLHRFLETSESS